MRAWLPPVVCLALALPAANAFLRSRTAGGVFTRRSDFTNIRFLVNDLTAPGLANNSGSPIITADSDPLTALQASVDAWTSVASSNAAFAPLGRTAQEGASNNGEHIITFADTPANRSVVGDALAVTRTFTLGGDIVDTDILFNPARTFSTTLQARTFDIQAVATHELGHALGAGHSGLLSATMYARTRSATNLQGLLTADDVAFLTEAYPRPDVLASFGSISGTVSLSGGGPVAGALVAAVDPSTGVAVGSLTAADGSYTIAKLPRGQYVVYAEPMDGPVFPEDVGSAGTGANTAFSTAFLGGAASPQAVSVGAGGTATANLTVEGGTPALNIEGAGSGPPGASIVLSGGSFALRPGETATVALFGTGLDDPSISESTISFLGAAITIQAGSLRQGRTTGSNLPLLNFVVQVAPTIPFGTATVLVGSAGGAAVFSAGAKILAPAPVFSAAGVVSAASFAPGGAAPGEIVSIFGTGLGPATGVLGSLDPGTRRLSSSAGNVSVTFNGVGAPLFFVRQDQINAQVPFEMAGQSSATVVVRHQSASSQPVRVPIAAARPGIFVRPESSQGIILNENGTLNDSGNPIDRGRVVVIFATGQGAISPALATGELAPSAPLSAVAQGVAVTFGGRPGNVLFAGMTPSFAGLLQVNVAVPIDAPVGANVAVTLSVGGISSQPNVTLAVR